VLIFMMCAPKDFLLVFPIPIVRGGGVIFCKGGVQLLASSFQLLASSCGFWAVAVTFSA
jgi:hypothetical protein